MRSTSIAAATVAVFGSLALSLGAVVEPRQSGRTTPILQTFIGQTILPSVAQILGLGQPLPIDNIQADIFVGMQKPKENFYFITINNAATFKSVLKNTVLSHVTSTKTLLSPPAQQPLAYLNVAFSRWGLNALGITDDLGDAQFSAGQLADADSLGDDQSTWEAVWKGKSIHALFLIGSDDVSHVTDLWNTVSSAFGSSITLQRSIVGSARPGIQAGHEHFGYMDGISQPAIAGFTASPNPGQAQVPSGRILTGRTLDIGVRPPWALDGSFLVFREMQQLVPEFHNFLQQNAVQNSAGTLTKDQGAELLGARMVGRWRSGAPVDLSPDRDDAVLAADPKRNNNFDFTHGLLSLPLTDQSHCPFAAHIRKTRPRADEVDVNVVNVVVRGGIPYGPEVTASENATHTTQNERGLAFVAYQANIALGFRFQQIQWANTVLFPPAKLPPAGVEPIIGQSGGGGNRSVTGLDPQNWARTMSIPEFVKIKGGEYFFSPSISSIRDHIAA